MNSSPLLLSLRISLPPSHSLPLSTSHSLPLTLSLSPRLTPSISPPPSLSLQTSQKYTAMLKFESISGMKRLDLYPIHGNKRVPGSPSSTILLTRALGVADGKQNAISRAKHTFQVCERRPCWLGVCVCVCVELGSCLSHSMHDVVKH